MDHGTHRVIRVALDAGRLQVKGNRLSLQLYCHFIARLNKHYAIVCFREYDDDITSNQIMTYSF